MFARFATLRLVVLAAALLCAGGCLNHSAASSARSEASVRRALEPSLQLLSKGRPQEGLSGLLGRPLDRQAWARVHATLSARTLHQARGQADQCAANIRQLADAIELYRADEANGYRLPTSLKDVIGLNGLTALPTCPSAGRDTYSVGYVVNRHDETFKLICKGHYHADAGLLANAPRYDARFGVLMPKSNQDTGWPTGYKIELVSVSMSPGHALATLRESGPVSAEVHLPLKPVTVAGKSTWIFDADEFSDVGASTLGFALSACASVSVASAVAPPAVDRRVCARNLARVATALEMYSSDHEGRYPNQLTALVPRYLPALPTCVSAAGEVVPTYTLSADGYTYDLSCAGQHPDLHLSNHPNGLREGTRVSASGSAF